MARIILKFKDRLLHVYPLSPHQPLTVGRRPANDIVIDNLAVSGHHARIENKGEDCTIVDLGSKNGTFLNGEPVIECPLRHQDAVTIGKHTLVVDLTDSITVDDQPIPDSDQGESPASFNDSQTMLMDKPVAHQMHAEQIPPATEAEHPETDLLAILSGAEGLLALSHKPITIGRNNDADIVVGGLWGLLMGSPAATINKQAGDVFLRFSGGLIKPKCNGAGVKGTLKLNHEDIVQVGPVKIKIQLSKRSAP